MINIKNQTDETLATQRQEFEEKIQEIHSTTKEKLASQQTEIKDIRNQTDEKFATQLQEFEVKIQEMNNTNEEKVASQQTEIKDMRNKTDEKFATQRQEFEENIQEIRNKTDEKFATQRQEFEDKIQDINNKTEETLVTQQQVFKEKIQDMNNTIEEKVATQQQQFEENIQEISNKFNEIQESNNNTNEIVATQQKEIKEMSNKTGSLEKNLEQALQPSVGFGVMRIKEVSSTAMTFSETITNVDSSYNGATDVFTCKIPGHYYISTSLLKEYYFKGSASCIIYKNDVKLVSAYTWPGEFPFAGNTAAVASTYVHMSAGDTVKLGGCSETASWLMGSLKSSFSGCLATPDAP